MISPVVIPAKAGIQALNLFLKKLFTDWIPAFAGMTVVLCVGVSFAQVSLGIDELQKNKFDVLKGRSVALITNQTGVDQDGDTTVDILRAAPGVKLLCVLTPEHGFRGVAEHGQPVLDWIDPQTKLQIYSLYGANTRPNDKMLKGVNTVVFDIQDIGTRFYTYITTMGMALEEASKRKLRFVVLDRPNPIRGDIIEGDILDPDIKRMTGYFQIPTRHGMTVGELAEWINKSENLHADLVVVPMKRWRRDFWYDQTGLDFVLPSPNIRSINEALLYSGIGCFEATNLSVGRGTDTPFEIFGAPWIKSNELCAFMRGRDFPGVLFEPVDFTPEKDDYAGRICHGVRMTITDRSRLRPFRIFIETFLFLHETYPKDFKPEWEEVRVVTGSDKLKQAADGKMTAAELFVVYDTALEAFRKQMEHFYLY